MVHAIRKALRNLILALPVLAMSCAAQPVAAEEAPPLNEVCMAAANNLGNVATMVKSVVTDTDAVRVGTRLGEWVGDSPDHAIAVLWVIEQVKDGASVLDIVTYTYDKCMGVTV